MLAFEQAALHFKSLVDSTCFPGVPVAEFSNLDNASRETVIRLAEASVRAAIAISGIAQIYPNSNARDNLVELRAAQRAFNQAKP